MLETINISYTFEALFAAFRISLWFVLLFGFIASLFLSHTRKLPIIEKLIYSWTGLGGVIVFAVFVLTTLHIYDFISIVLTLLLIPLIRNIWRRRDQGIRAFFEHFELRALASQVRMVEQWGAGGWKAIRRKWQDRSSWRFGGFSESFAVLLIALAGALIRMYPALMNAAPFSRSWYFQLDRIKNLRLQQYFGAQPEPGGMHSLVSVFSMFTQVSPEMILHLLGALTSFFLCILIYWATRDLTKNRMPMAPFFAMSVYALTPMLLMPVSLEQQAEPNTLDLALCFALPTLTIFIRNIRSDNKSPWFYVLSGFIATAMTNLFIGLGILLPFMFLGLLSLPRRRYFRSFLKVSAYLLAISILVVLPFAIVVVWRDMDGSRFIMEQLYDTSAYSYFPKLVMPLGRLSTIYALIGGGLFLGYLGEYILKGGRKVSDEMIFLAVFAALAAANTAYFHPDEFIWFDADQLNPLFAVTIAMFAGVLFSSVMRIMHLIPFPRAVSDTIAVLLLVVAMGTLVWMQGGIYVSRNLPNTVPNGFYKAYYKIIRTRLPYSYATVGPEIERINAKNRHFFMNYRYFMDEYGRIDSLYHAQLQVPRAQRKLKSVPPASIFVFTENPPYGIIQQGILYADDRVMRDLDQWLVGFRDMPDRDVEVYYQDTYTTVYEIVNRSGASDIDELLLHIHPGDGKKGILSAY